MADITIEEENGIVKIFGKRTFNYKESLKKLGFRWNLKDKYWFRESCSEKLKDVLQDLLEADLLYTQFESTQADANERAKSNISFSSKKVSNDAITPATQYKPSLKSDTRRTHKEDYEGGESARTAKKRENIALQSLEREGGGLRIIFESDDEEDEQHPTTSGRSKALGPRSSRPRGRPVETKKLPIDRAMRLTTPGTGQRRQDFGPKDTFYRTYDAYRSGEYDEIYSAPALKRQQYEEICEVEEPNIEVQVYCNDSTFY